MTTRRFLLIPLAFATAVAIAACSQQAGTSETETNTAQSDTQASPPAEVSGPEERLVATHDGGIAVLNAQTLEVVSEIPLDGFNRLNPLGDERTIAVSTPKGFRVLDAGAWTEPHGDHSHSYTSSPRLTEHVYEGEKPGHAVNHNGRTLLFSDGDGRIQEVDNNKLKEATHDSEFAPPETITEITPHHGVAVALEDGGMAHTEGTEEERSSIIAVDAEGTETARIDTCPGVHGEATAGNDAITFGCDDGVVIYKNGTFTKVDSPDSYGRMGNQSGSDASDIVLADYKTDKDAELERPTRVALIDTQSEQLQLVDVDASYSFRSLGRGPEGEALVLGTDGILRIIDPDTGAITTTIHVTEAWNEPTVWQQERPTLYVQGDKAYVTEPGAQLLHVVNIDSGEVEQSKDVGHSLNELTGIAG